MSDKTHTLEKIETQSSMFDETDPAIHRRDAGATAGATAGCHCCVSSATAARRSRKEILRFAQNDKIKAR